ncbi:MAG: alpha/beta fold hydrolase [Pseudomonadota bacterium]
MTRRTVLLGALGLGGLAAGAAAWRSAAAEDRFPPQGVFETVEGVRLHLRDQGPADGPAVVLIHGASGNLRDFDFGLTAALLAQGWRVLAVDRPGHGHSERGPADAHRPDVQARLLRGAVAARGVDRAVILGHSLGAAVALAWCLDAPDMAAGCVDLAGAAMPWPGGVDMLYRAASTPLLGRIASNAISLVVSDSFVKTAIGGIFAPQRPPEGYLEGIGAGLAIRPATQRHNGEDIAYLKPYLAGQSKRYPGLAPPLEILHGDADTIVPARIHAEPLSRLAPRARLNLLPGIGHMPHHAAQGQVLDALGRLRGGV